MPSPELNPDWVLSSSPSETRAQPLHPDNELISVASRLWPRVQAHARRALANKNSDESVTLAAEVWEGVLQSVAKTRQRRNGKGAEILDLEAYLFGAFHHRFNRALKEEGTTKTGDDRACSVQPRPGATSRGSGLKVFA